MALRKPLSEKRTPHFLLRFTADERAQLDQLVDRYGVETSTFLRTLIELTARGDVQLPTSAFDHTL